MPYQPIIPIDGYGGWLFLQRTLDRQVTTFNEAADFNRDVEYFRENIYNATNVEDLVTDRRLLKVALGAFGLEDEINKQAFVRKILEEGTIDSKSFANRLNNQQYKDLATNFPYGNGGFFPSTPVVERIIQQYKDRSFEVAVGEVNTDMRLALNFERTIGEVASTEGSEKTLWFKIMGDRPLRAVFETAYNLPTEFSQLDIDQQAEVFATKTRREFGDRSPSVFTDPKNIEKMIRVFTARSQINAGPSALTPGFSGLAVLQASGFGASASQNLLLSNI